MIRLFFAFVRRDRVMLPVWVLATGLLAFAAAKGVQTEFATDADRSAVLEVALATPSLLALRGAPDGASLGSYVYFQVFCYLAIMAALMSTFLVTRHTRADEERGRAELVGATPVGRASSLAATIALGTLANAVLAVLVALGLMGGGLEAGGSWVAGLATGATGFAFVGLAALAAQVAPTSRAANGLSAALVGVAFLLRALGDATGEPDIDRLTLDSAWPSWLSPIGWGQQVFAFTRADLAPLGLSAGVGVLAAAIAIVVVRRRDIGSSLLRERQGRARGRISTQLALAWRQQWPSLIGWTIGGALTGALAGTLASTIANADDLSENLEEILSGFVPGGPAQLTDLLVVAIMSVAGILAAMAGIQAVMRARGEESDGRVELVLASPVSRVGWLASYVIVAIASSAAVALTAGLVTGLSFLSSDDGSDRFWSSLGAGVAQLPAALTFISVTALVFAILPRLTIPVGWTIIVVGFIIGQFGGLLQIPEDVRNISPFLHTPAIPGPDPDWGGALWLVAISIVLLAASAIVIRTRQLTT